MEEILKTEIIDSKKSRFYLEIVRAPGGQLYVAISQDILTKINEPMVPGIRIRVTDLEKIIGILISYQLEIKSKYPRKKALSIFKREELISRYLNKGLEIEALAVQFDCSVAEIKQLLFENNIVITSNSIEQYKPVKRFRRRKRKRPE